MKASLYIGFALLMIFEIARLYFYTDFKYIHGIYSQETILSVIPFFVSEITISIVLSYVLFSVARMENKSSLKNEMEENAIESLSTDSARFCSVEHQVLT